MTKEEAKIVFLNRGYVEVEGGTVYDPNKWREACHIISDWLEQQSCDDCVSRQAVIDLIKSDWKYEGLETDVASLPPVTPQPKTGHWFIDERPESNREVICSNCEQTVFKYHKLDFDYRPKYCPNCGAKMQAESEAQDANSN